MAAVTRVIRRLLGGWFPPPVYRVVLYQEPLSRQWVVQLHKMGARLTVCRSRADVKQGAEGQARSLALFLGAEFAEVAEPPVAATFGGGC